MTPTVQAQAILRGHCGGRDTYLPPLLRGSTSLRLHESIRAGASAEEAAAQEYLMRWRMALAEPRAFEPPHPFGL